MKMVYCKKWNHVRKKPQDVLLEARARALHENEEPYCIIFYKADGRLYRIIEMCFINYYCNLLYYDELGRNTRRESFKLHGERLWMRNTVDRFYAQDGKEVVAAYDILYEHDGTYKGIKYESGQETTEEGRANPKILYRDIPAFGAYQILFKNPPLPPFSKGGGGI